MFEVKQKWHILAAGLFLVVSLALLAFYDQDRGTISAIETTAPDR